MNSAITIDYSHIIYSGCAVLLFVSYHSVKPLIKISALELISEQRIRWSVWRSKEREREYIYSKALMKANQ
jgi:hypothetical protein